MSTFRRLPAIAILLLAGCFFIELHVVDQGEPFIPLQEKAPPKDKSAPQARAKLEDLVKIEFPKDGYRFTLAEVAKGIKIKYTIKVQEDIEGVNALPFGPSAAEPAGPSGLHPREEISGNKQLYCLMDFGLAPPPTGVVKTLKKGSYAHAFDWDGRNWTGPSDFGNPKGKPFPAGTYDVIVTMHGNVVKGQKKAPYQITAKTKLVLE